MCCIRSDYRGRVNSHCFPFRQVPHSTRLFLDYLEHTSPARQFFPRSPRFREWVNDESARIDYPANRREQLARILERQNKSFGASPRTLENIAAFSSGASAIVTGQQVGLFGGPAFSIYKALSAITLAKDAQNLGVDCVPIFWLATEDHDLQEVNQIRIPAADATLETLATTARAAEDAPVGTISFGPEISELALRVENLLGGESEITKLLTECYRPGETFGTAFAKLFARIFAGFGVIILDGSDPELDQIAAPLYLEVIERSPELNRALLHRDEELHAAGYHQQVRITGSSTPLFVIRNGSRIPVHAAAEKFLIGHEEMSQQELLQLASSSPESFSPNVLLRPVVQDYLLPTLAYVGGSAEVAYFAQAAAVYQSILGRVTPIVPRFSATLVEAKPQALLERYKLSFSDLFHGPEALRERIGSHLLGSNLQNSFQQAKTAMERSMIAVREALAHLDKTLVESAQNAESKMLYQLTNLQSRAARAELRHSEVADRHARFLSNTLYPEKTLQEREVAGVYFLAKHGRELLDGLLGTINPDCVDHQLVTL
jgi:bacillithiol biosynthesis cysteine-adding enzyme BshC